MDRATRASIVIERLEREFPDWDCTLTHEDPWQLLIATMLSAQSTDAMVNTITPPLFDAYPDAKAMAAAPPADIERLVRPTGYFRQKARRIREASAIIVNEFGGEVPRTMEELTRLPGVARKTANVVLHNAFGVTDGIAVDTHVLRLTRRLRLTRHSDPVKVERDLMRSVPRQDWHKVTHLLIEHGRATCVARKPRCRACALADVCPSSKRFLREERSGGGGGR